MIANAETIKAAATLEEVLSHLGYQVDSRQRCQCPVHQGKDKNFSVKNGFGTCHSQCGQSWDAVGLLMEVKGLTYPEALEELARITKQEVEYTSGQRAEIIEKSKAEQEAREAVYLLNERTLIQYEGGEEIILGNRYQFDTREWSGETVKAFRLVTTPDKNLAVALAESENALEAFEKAGLIATGKSGSKYDFFRNRILFPIHNHQGKIAGFTARKLSNDNYEGSPKYKNSPETIAYHKEEILYGLWQNRRGIRDQGAIIVEGNADVVTCYDHGIRNVVASGGTAVTEKQLRLLKRYTKEVTFLMDGDEAGRKAAKRGVEFALQEGLRVKVAFFEDPPQGLGDDKYDPDNFLRAHGKGGMEVFLEEKSQDGLIWLVMDQYSPTDIFQKEVAIELAARMIANLESEMLQDFYLRELSDSARMKDESKILKDRVKKEIEKRLAEANKPKLTNEQRADIVRYGLYENGNQYYVSGNQDAEGFPISNFIIRPLMVIVGSQQSARLVEIVNQYGHKFTANINSDDFTEMGTFKKQVERHGNYLFWEGAKPEHYVKIKRKVYDQMGPCFPITTLGYHKQGFWAWANGIVVGGEFKPVDEYGMVTHGEHRFYLPMFGNINNGILSDDDDSGYEDMKAFIHTEEIVSPTFQEWSRCMYEVHGHNGMVGVAYYCAALFRDIIYKRFQFFPHLNLFGPPQSGKSFLAWSIGFMFDKPPKPFNLNDGTDVAFYRSMAVRRNAVTWFDEYSNSVHFKRIQALKQAYDGAGRIKGIATNDNRTTTTKVNSACIISGQVQPVHDNALFTRCISLNFRTPDLGAKEMDERRRRADELKNIESTGALSQITSQLQKYRKLVDDKFDHTFEDVRSAVLEEIRIRKYNKLVEDRVLKNYCIPMTIVTILYKELAFGFALAEFYEFCVTNMLGQVDAMTEQDDLAVWWQMLEFYIEQGELKHDQDLVVQEIHSLTVKDATPGNSTTQVVFEDKRKVLFLRFTKSYRFYLERMKREGSDMGLNQEALKYYLRISPAFIGEVRAKKFDGKAKSCYAFDMSKLPIDIPLSILTAEPEDEF